MAHFRRKAGRARKWGGRNTCVCCGRAGKTCNPPPKKELQARDKYRDELTRL